MHDNVDMGPVEVQVRRDVEALGNLRGVLPSTAQVAFVLARILDHEPGMIGAAVARELRATLEMLTEATGRDEGEAQRQILDVLRAPVGDSAKPGKGNSRRKGRAGGPNSGDAVDAVATPRTRRGVGDRS